MSNIQSGAFLTVRARKSPLQLRAATGARAGRAGTRGMPRERREQLILDVAGHGVRPAPATTRPRWTRSPTPPACPSRCSTPTSAPRRGCTWPTSSAPAASCSSGSWRATARRVARRAPAGADHRVPGVRRGAPRRVEGAVRRGRLDAGRSPSSVAAAARADRRRDPPDDRGRRRLAAGLRAGRPSDAIAHALVGAGESLANWWLDHPEVARDEVADWYFGGRPGRAGRPERPSG